MDALNNVFSDYAFYFLLTVFAVEIVLATLIFVLRKNIKNIFRGENLDIEKVLAELRSGQDSSGKFMSELQSRILNLENALPKNIRKVGLIRYNPFSDAGGDQSFALALLNDNKDGVIISSLYGREINKVYAKPIQNGGSTYQLTAEEKQAIENAK